MDKGEIKNGLIAAGLINRYDKSAYWWKEAFKLYNVEHNLKGDAAMDMSCNRCIGEVHKWIKE